MLLSFFDKKIRQAFSNAAYEYDLLSSLHKEIGRELVRKIAADTLREPQAILDVGMGTGWLTSKVQFYFPEAAVIGLDLAEGMLEVARQQHDDLRLIQANASNLPFRTDTFDLIVSNLSLQWVSSLRACFVSMQHSLKAGGQLQLTMFGRDTFRELFTSLEEGARSSGGTGLRRLHSKEAIEDALRQSGFKNILVDHEIIKVHFADMYRLIRWIKDIGANTLSGQMYIGKERLASASEFYEKNFRDKFGIVSTFEVIWVQADK